MDLPYRKDDLHSRKMTNGLQQKVNFLVSKLFRGGREVQKVTFASDKCNKAANRFYLSKKEIYNDNDNDEFNKRRTNAIKKL